MAFEDTLRALLDAAQQTVGLLEQMAERSPMGSSNLTIEDMSKGPPKVTTHGSVGIPLSEEFIRGRIAEHGLAHRLAEEAQKADWKLTADLAAAGVSLADMRRIGQDLAADDLPLKDVRAGETKRAEAALLRRAFPADQARAHDLDAERSGLLQREPRQPSAAVIRSHNPTVTDIALEEEPLPEFGTAAPA